ncbi:hypothetical protein AAIH70_27335 [Neorhizobium sp. BT27B]|uniref:hypothetical protein n=1 Tax=Neorhizobium sp. BT27B TaxID=3142625 RepID=UPI003D2B9F9D
MAASLSLKKSRPICRDFLLLFNGMPGLPPYRVIAVPRNLIALPPHGAQFPLPLQIHGKTLFHANHSTNIFLLPLQK